MKKLLSNQVFWFSINWLRSPLAAKPGGKPDFSPVKRHKKLSPKHEHLLKVARLFKNRIRQMAWMKH
jgi:hypothetical protein